MRREGQTTGVILFDDALREREADAPAALLRREAGLEDARPQIARNARAVVGNPNDDAAMRRHLGAETHAPAATGERVDRVLREHFHGPLDEHGIAIDGWKIGRDVALHDD